MKRPDRFGSVVFGPLFDLQQRLQIGFAPVAGIPAPVLGPACGATVHTPLSDVKKDIVEFGLLPFRRFQISGLNRIPDILHKVDHFIPILFRRGIEF